ncbi:MAG: hypothetical protein ACK45H_00040 [Bacteroidota bacterium]|jgi:hypothetical protein
MKQVIPLMLLLVVLSSCGALAPVNGKIRLVRSAKSEEVKVIERSTGSSELAVLEEVAPASPKVMQRESGTLETSVDNASKDFPTLFPEDEERKDVKVEIRSPEDLLPDEDERIINEALKAERDANSAFWLFLTGLSSVFVPYLGFIPFIIGLIFYSRSRNARYITPLGERRSSAATVLLVIDSIVLVLWLILIIALILAF